MKNDNDMKELFDKFRGQWDTEEPLDGHDQRFMARLEGRKKKKFPYRLFFPIAAAALILIGVFITREPDNSSNPVAKMSPEVKETQMYFAAIIEKELAKVEKEDSPETKRLVQDALYRMQALEKDYDRLTRELMEKGENRQIIKAMVTNLQTRISFLEEVLIKIENIKQLKENYHEENQT